MNLIFKNLELYKIYLTGIDGGRGFLKICLTIHSIEGNMDVDDDRDPTKSPEKKKRPRGSSFDDRFRDRGHCSEFVVVWGKLTVSSTFGLSFVALSLPALSPLALH